MPIEMIIPCPQCGEKNWLSHGSQDIAVVPQDLLEKDRNGEKINWGEYNFDHIKTVGFTCKSCGYTVMKDENGNLTKINYTDIEK